MRLKQTLIYPILILGLLGCSDKNLEESHLSPSGKYTMNVLVGDDDKNSKMKYLIFLQLISKTGNELDLVNTRASVLHNYAAYWDSENTIVLYSSDIGILAWVISDEKLLPISVDSDITKRAETFFKKKMGR